MLTNKQKQITLPSDTREITRLITETATRSVSENPDDRIFNFNLNECFELKHNMRFFTPLTNDAELIYDHQNSTLAWSTNVPLAETGIILRMETIPSSVYHVFIKASTLLGPKLIMRVRNRTPELNLTTESVWKIGTEETHSVCFRALTNETDLVIINEVDCCLPVVPFAFIMNNLTIIPDCFMCQGFLLGPTGPTGFTGQSPFGPSGPQGLEGPQGPLGTGDQGFIGFQGFTGATGNKGIRGTTSTITGSQGAQGAIGFAGISGAIGANGVDGFQGSQGLQGYSGTQGTFVVSWTVGSNTSVPVATSNITYEKIGLSVTLTVPTFIVGMLGTNSALNGSMNFPSEIRTTTNKFMYLPGLIYVNATAMSNTFQLGPNRIIIYKTLDPTSFFSGTDYINIPTQTFTYYLS